MRDLTFFSEGNHKPFSNGLINFSKIRTLVPKVCVNVMCKLGLLIVKIHMMPWGGGTYTLHVQYGEEGDICLLCC